MGGGEKEGGNKGGQGGRGQFEERGVKRGLSVYVKERIGVQRKPR